MDQSSVEDSENVVSNISRVYVRFGLECMLQIVEYCQLPIFILIIAHSGWVAGLLYSDCLWFVRRRDFCRDDDDDDRANMQIRTRSASDKYFLIYFYMNLRS